MILVDTGGANLSSVQFGLERIGVSSRLSSDPDEITRSPRVILPGVGAARHAMGCLQERELIHCLRELRQPVLGICLGMQLLFESSEEGDVKTLGILPGRVTKMKPEPGISIPHMGWNRVRVRNGKRSALLSGLEVDPYFYFVHSYAAEVTSDVVASCEHGGEVPAIVERGNWMGVQFHPERSGLAGEQLLRNFMKWEGGK